MLSNGLPARASVTTAGLDEFAIHVTANTKGDQVRFHPAVFTSEEVFGTTWLEPREGAWLQPTPDGSRKPLPPLLAELTVKPQGIGDRGKLIV